VFEETGRKARPARRIRVLPQLAQLVDGGADAAMGHNGTSQREGAMDFRSDRQGLQESFLYCPKGNRPQGIRFRGGAISYWNPATLSTALGTPEGLGCLISSNFYLFSSDFCLLPFRLQLFFHWAIAIAPRAGFCSYFPAPCGTSLSSWFLLLFSIFWQGQA
jgi:hypothetical protein